MNTDTYFAEYTSSQAILKYTRATAGFGISHLLNHDYKTLYLEALRKVPPASYANGLRILEFGCGAGMNLLHLVSLLEDEGMKVVTGFGSDFSPVLIDAAKSEAKNHLPEMQQQKINFCIARNEALVEDLSITTGKAEHELCGSFHFIMGVNTIRYTHRLGKAVECAQGIYDLLAPGGMCVVIDMNDRFPIFRSAIRDRLHKNKHEYYLPSLEEYAAPLAKVGLQILRQEHFSWIPHSSGPWLCRFLDGLSPLLNKVAKSRAMRSVVVAQKPCLGFP